MKRGCLVAIVGACLGTASSAGAYVNPQSLELEVYRFAVSTSGDCANPTVIFASDAPMYVDLATAPTLGAGHLEDGSYECLMIEMSPVVLVTPAGSEGSCSAGVEYRVPICAEGLVEPHDGGVARTARLLDGSTADCSSSDRVVLYLSLWSSGATSTAKPFNPFEPPAARGDADHGILLAGALVVSGGGRQVGTLEVEAEGSVYSDGASCRMFPPKFLFESTAGDATDGGDPAGAKASGAPPGK